MQDLENAVLQVASGASGELARQPKIDDAAIMAVASGTAPAPPVVPPQEPTTAVPELAPQHDAMRPELRSVNDDAVLSTAARAIAATPKTFGGELAKGLTQARAIPYVHSLVEGSSLVSAIDAANEVGAKGWQGASPQAKGKLLDVWAEGQQESGFGATTGAILSGLPGYAGEFGLTMGAHELAKEGVEKLVSSQIKAKVEELALKKGLQGLVGKMVVFSGKAAATAAGSVAQMPLMPQLFATEALQQQLKETGMQVSEDATKKLQVTLAQKVPALWDVLDTSTRNAFAEIFSEHTGAVFTGLNRLSWKLVSRLGGHTGAAGDKAASEIMERLEKYGWHGIGESFEERVGELMKGEPITTGFSWKNGQLHVEMSEVKQLAAEMAAFGGPTLGMQGLERAHDIITGRAAEQGTGEAAPAKASSAPHSDTGPGAASSQGAEVAPVSQPSVAQAVRAPIGEGSSLPTPSEVVGSNPSAGSTVPRGTAVDVPPEVQEAADALGKANRAKGSVRVLEPDLASEDPWFDRARERGVPVYEVDAGQKLNAPAMYRGGSMFLDVNAEPQERKSALIIHELVHAMKDAAGASYRALAESLPEDWLNRSWEDYSRAREAVTGRATNTRNRKEEAVSHLLEHMQGVVALALQDPDKIVHAVRGTFWQNLADGILETTRLVGIRLPSFKEKRLRALRNQVAKGRYEKEMDPALALNISMLARDAFNGMLGASKSLSEAPARAAAATIDEKGTTNAGDVLESGGQTAEAEAQPGALPGTAASEGTQPAAADGGGAGEEGRGAGARGDEAEEPAAGRVPSEARPTAAGLPERAGERDGGPEGHGPGAGAADLTEPASKPDADRALFDKLLNEAFKQEAAPGQTEAEAPSHAQPTQVLPKEPTPAPSLRKPKKSRAKEMPRSWGLGERVRLKQYPSNAGVVVARDSDRGITRVRMIDGEELEYRDSSLELAPEKPAPRADGLSDVERKIKEDLEELFAVEPLDEEKYAKASRSFDQATALLSDEQKASKESVLRALIEFMRDKLKLAKEKIQAAYAYVARYAGEFIERTEKKRPTPKSELPANTSAIEVKPFNYEIRPEDLDFQGEGAVAKGANNLAAIRLLKDLESQGRDATLEEKRVLVRYVGWGDTGLANGIFPNPQTGEFKPEWSTAGKELRALLSDEEYRRASASTTDAHYTSKVVVDGIWAAMQRMGFNGGKVLEPGMGIGGFLGLAPRFDKGLHYIGIERDPVTARIAKKLYGNAIVNNADYTEVKLPHDHFDAAVGNPPFGDKKITADKEYAKNSFAIHNYFFAKTIERVRPGGLLAFVTSRYSLDSQDETFRNWMNQRAEFLGAIRLPSTAFKQNAGTQVVTDIIFLRRRAEGEVSMPETAFPQIGRFYKNFGGSANRSEYYTAHPEMVLGTEEFVRGMHHANEYSVKPSGDLDAQLTAAVKKLPANVYRERVVAPKLGPKETKQQDLLRELAPETVLEGAFYVNQKGLLMRRELGQGVELPTKGEGAYSKSEVELIRSFIPLRQAARAVLRAQVEGKDSKPEQAALKRAYDEFVKKHGPVNKRQGRMRRTKTGQEEIQVYPNYAAFQEDPEAALVGSLDFWDEKTGELQRSQIFTDKVVRPDVQAEPKNAMEAAFVSLNQVGKIELARVASMLKKTEDEVRAELGASVYDNPATGELDLADEYLSGNVRTKLAAARERASVDPGFDRNVKALEAVIPEDIPHTSINARFGVGWVPLDDYQDFLANELKVPGWRLGWIKETGSWTVSETRGAVHDREIYGIAEMPAHKIFESVLNGRSPVVAYTDREGKRIVQVDETAAAQAKAREIEEKFADWLFRTDDRQTRLVRLFNDEHNNFVPWKPDGSHLHLPGSNFPFRAHQKNAIWRAIRRGNSYINHAVGAGKTAVEASIAMELKRLGLVAKPAIAVPGHMLRQFANEMLRIYPAAKILVADEENFSAKKRKLFAAKAAANRWDAVVFSHSALRKVPLSAKQQRALLDLEIERMLDAIKDLDGKDPTRKQVEKQIAKREDRVKKLSDEEGQDKVVNFEELGVDFLIVDEAHEFRKMDIATTRGRLKGISTQGSGRSWDLYGKVRYLETLRPGRTTVLASGTPVTNTIGELYTLQRYLQERELDSMGIMAFDAWANMFGRTETSMERGVKGDYKQVERFAKFTNLRVLSRMLATVMDTVTDRDLDFIKRPTLQGGQAEIAAAPSTEGLRTLKANLVAMIDQAETRERGIAYLNAIRLDSFGAIDLRSVDPTAKDSPDSKLNMAIAEGFKIWGETVEHRGTQMIFCDLQTAKESPSFDIHDALRSGLITRGVPANEILLMRDLDTITKKANAFTAMNSGAVRFLIGGKNMETGVNAQERLYALHHLDVAWYPAQMVQREGRIIRQGNMWASIKPVRILRWTTKGTIEADKWQALERKAKAIASITQGIVDFDEIDDIDESASYAMAKAVATGDPRVLQMAGLDIDVQRLARQAAEHAAQKRIAQTKLPQEKKGAEIERANIASLEAAAAAGDKVGGDEFSMRVGDASFEKRTAAGAALLAALKSLPEAKTFGDGEIIGRYGDFDIRARAARYDTMKSLTKNVEGLAYYVWLTHGEQSTLSGAYQIDPGEEASPAGLVASLVAQATSGFHTRLQRARESLQSVDSRISRLEEQLKGEFRYADELARKQAELKEIQDLVHKGNAAHSTAGTEEAPANPADKGDAGPSEDEDEDLLAVDEDDQERIRELAATAKEEGEESLIGLTPYRRTPIGADAQTRANMRAIDEWRHEAGRPEVVPIVSQEKRADRALEEDRNETTRDVLTKLAHGTLLQPWEMKVAARLVQERMFTGGAGWMDIADALRDNRADVARALGVLRDPLLASMNGRERMIDLLSILSRDGRRRLARIKARLKLPTLTREQRTKLERERRAVLAHEEELTARAKANLREAGFDPKLISSDYFRDPIVRARIVRIVHTSKSGFWDWVIEYSLFSMLSGPLTQKANLLGNISYGAYNVGLRRMVEVLVNQAFRDPNSAQAGELRAIAGAQKEAWMNAARFWSLAMRTELPAFEADLAEKGVEVELAGGHAARTGEAMHGPAIPGSIGRAMRTVSTDLLLANDEAMKAVISTIEATALALRAAKEEGHTGPALEQRMREILDDHDHPIHLDAFTTAKKSLFQAQAGGLTTSALKARAWLDDHFGGVPIGTLLFPFVNTPAQIFGAGLTEAAMPLIYLAKLGKSATSTFGPYRGDRRELVQDTAHAITSLMVMLGVYSLIAASGGDPDDLPLITGSGGDDWRAEERGVPPYSILIGGRYRSYSRLEPFAVHMGTLVDLANAFRAAAADGPGASAQAAGSRLISSVVTQATDKTFLQTFTLLYNAAQEKGTSKAFVRLSTDLAARSVPNIVKQPLGYGLETRRESGIRNYDDMGIWEAGMTRALPQKLVPVQAVALPPRYDLWGRPVPRYPGDESPAVAYAIDLLSPLTPGRATSDIHKLDRLLIRYNDRVARGEIPEGKPAHPTAPATYWETQRAGRIYWSDAEYEILSRDAGQRAAERLSNMHLHWTAPTEQDLDVVSQTIADERARVREELLHKRKAGAR